MTEEGKDRIKATDRDNYERLLTAKRREWTRDLIHLLLDRPMLNTTIALNSGGCFFMAYRVIFHK